MPRISDNLDRLNTTRDLSLPDWGPYSIRHWSISHIADPERGTLFECVPMPGLFCRRVYYPLKKGCVDWTPLEANADLSVFGWRCHMEPQLFADLRVFDGGENARLWETTFHNQRDVPMNFMLDFFLGFQSQGEQVEMKPDPKITFLSAAWYEEVNVDDLRGSSRDQNRDGAVSSPCLIERTGLRPLFACREGAEARYMLKRPARVARARLGIRYALSGNSPVKIRMRLDRASRVLTLRPTGEGLSFDTLTIAWTAPIPVSGETLELTLTVLEPSTDGELTIDGFFLTPPNKEPQLTRVDGNPSLKTTVDDDLILVESPLAPGKVYGIKVQAAPKLHTWRVRVPDHLFYNQTRQNYPRFWLRNLTSPSGDDTWYGDLRPLTCPAKGTLTVRCVVAVGENASVVKRRLSSSLRNWTRTVERVSKLHEKTKYVSPSARYGEGLEAVMKATLTSVFYPQDFLREHVRYFGPGAYFSMLYLWDAGMQGLALTNYAPSLALEGLNTYLNNSDLPTVPVILHGSMLPTQPYLYWELFERTGDRAMLAFLYKKMRMYYRFFAGKDGSMMDSFGSGLLNPWKYFYNSAGWDDYPAQVHVFRNRLRTTMSPVANTAHTIRGARIMALAALELGYDADAEEYLADAARMSEALLKYSWDEKSGYFSYVTDKGKKRLEYRRGVNFNMGLDGVSPLVAGIVAPKVTKRLIEHCKSGQRLWSCRGLSTVDQSAPYFDPGGYWNGGVWIAHQWFMFKAFLDYGESELALKLADTVVAAWHNAVVDARGQTYEAISIIDGQGYGTAYFSALSAPVVPMGHACSEVGRLTSGFDTRVSDVAFEGKRNRLSAKVWCPFGAKRAGFLAVMGKPGRYCCTVGEKTRYCVTDSEGRLAFAAAVPSHPTTLSLELADKA